MVRSWWDFNMLALEASGVACLRMMHLAGGGGDAQRESELMVSEKIAAGWEAAATLMCGGSVDTVIGRYREAVAANGVRLMRAMYAPYGGCAAPAETPRRAA